MPSSEGTQSVNAVAQDTGVQVDNLLVSEPETMEEDVVAIGMNLWQFILFISGVVLVVVIVAVACWMLAAGVL